MQQFLPTSQRSRQRKRQYGLRARAIFLGLVAMGLLFGGLVPAGPAFAAVQPGPVLVWGDNRSSQLGLAEDAVARAAAKPVTAALDSGVIAVAGGGFHSLALKADGSVLSWGDNSSSGQLGQGTTVGSLDPAQVQGVSGATAIAAGRAHSLAIAGGNVFVWGDNAFGQLGTATSTVCNSGFTCSRVAIQVGSLAGAKAIGAGTNHSLVVLNDGTVRSWGNNAFGALGDGSTTRRLAPVTVIGPGGSGFLGNIIAVTGGEAHSLALAADGTVYAWGQNGQGQLGLGSADVQNHTAPTQIPGLSGIVAIASGYRFNLALKNDGTVYAWGQNEEGQLGNNSVGTGACTCQATPALVPGLGGVAAIGAGNWHSLAALTDGTVRAWGNNGSLQVGVTAPDKVLTPSAVPGVTGAQLVAGGGRHSIALRAVPQFTLQVSTNGSGSGTVTPGSGTHPTGAQVSLTPQSTGDSVFTGWTVDGVAVGHAAPLTITMNADHSVVATFALPPTFCDVNLSDPYFAAIRQLAARGIIRGFDAGDGQLCFGPNDNTLRAQMAALVARPFGWDQESHPNPFTDRGQVDDNLWTSVGSLAFYEVARGYKPETCVALGVQPPCYGPTDHVLHAQVISFITRGMVEKGYWEFQADNGAAYPNVAADSGHRVDLATYVHYAGALPGTGSSAESWGVWDQPATRGWFAEALWRALDSYFSLDQTP